MKGRKSIFCSVSRNIDFVEGFVRVADRLQRSPASDQVRPDEGVGDTRHVRRDQVAVRRRRHLRQQRRSVSDEGRRSAAWKNRTLEEHA